MTCRAVILGLAMGLLVSAVAYFNDFVICQTPLINHLLPVVLLGMVLGLVLLVNPWLARWGERWSLSTREVAVVAALGLVACSWPEAGFYRTALTNVAMPAHHQLSQPAWRGHNLFAYVPDGPAILAEGHVRDWPTLAERLMTSGRTAPQSVLGRIWQTLEQRQEHHAMAEVARTGRTSAEQRRLLVQSLNHILQQAPLHEADDADALALPASARRLLEQTRGDEPQTVDRLALNRQLLVAALSSESGGPGEPGEPGVVLPPPPGSGVLLLGGRTDPTVTDPLLYGGRDRPTLGWRGIPWHAWWPVIRLWGAAALLLGLATFCLALVVHPQWSRSELLPYPIAKFVNGLAEREPGQRMPTVTLQKLFWVGFLAMLVLHLVNGLATWFPEQPIPTTPRRLDFNPLRTLFPDASRVRGSEAYFWPILFYSVIAFAFFLPRQVSLSMGLAPMLFLILGSAMLKSGATLDEGYLGAGRANMLRFGGYLGMAAMIVYTGRRYYLQVAAGAVGLGHARGNSSANPQQLPATTIWAARAFILLALAAVVVLTHGGLHVSFAVACVLLVLLIYLVISRIVAETGMFMIQAYWMPVAVLTALMGFEAIGPTTYLVLALASTMIVGDTRTAVMANIVNALQIVDRSGEKTQRAAPWLAVMLVAGFLVAGLATMYVAYHFNAFGQADNFTRNRLPTMPFEELTRHVTDASAVHRLADATALRGWQHWAAARFEGDLLAWTGIGLALVLVTAAARLRLPWWPLHPVVFLVWGTYPATRFAFSFLLGWLLRSAVTTLVGSRGYRMLLPLMVGIIAGEVAASFLWLAVGGAYYFTMGLRPPMYLIF